MRFPCIRTPTFLAAMAAAIPVLAAEPSSWTFQANLNLWATSISGDVGVRGLPTVNVDVGFLDIIDNIDGAIMGSLYATNGNWVVLTDLVWAELSDKVDVGSSGNVKLQEDQGIVYAVVGHTLPLNVHGLQLSAVGGVRYNYFNTELKINPAAFPSVKGEKSRNWIDPVVGAFMHYDIDQRWYVNALADVGGFGAGSDIAAQGFLALGYKWTERFSTALGYRALYTDYDRDGFTYRVTQHGPFLGLGYRF